MTSGFLLYAFWCPKEIRRCAEPDDYLLEHFQLRNVAHLFNAIRRCVDAFIYVDAEKAKSQIASFHPGNQENLIWGEISPHSLHRAAGELGSLPDPFSGRAASTTANVLRANFVLLDVSQPIPRITSVLLLGIGAVIFLWPAANVVLQTLRKTLLIFTSLL